MMNQRILDSQNMMERLDALNLPEEVITQKIEKDIKRFSSMDHPSKLVPCQLILIGLLSCLWNELSEESLGHDGGTLRKFWMPIRLVVWKMLKKEFQNFWLCVKFSLDLTSILMPSGCTGCRKDFNCKIYCTGDWA